MDTNKMRDQFEACWKRQLWAECYEDVKEQMFSIWKASRDAVAVELPDVANYEVYDQQHDFLHTDEVTLMEAVSAAIEAQGLKVKP